jgi:MFS family permease
MNDRNYLIIYLIGLGLTSLLMILILFGILRLNFTFLIFFWVVKFLAGFGLILSISNGFLLLLDKTKEKIGKSEKVVNNIVAVQIIIPFILIIWAIYQVISSYLDPGLFSQDKFIFWIDLILFVYGIASLLINLYIIPIIREQFEKAVDQGKFQRFKKSVKKVGRGIKKKYFRFRKDYAKVQIQDQMTIKELLNLWQSKFAVYFLLIVAVGSLTFSPITFICIMFWLAIFEIFDGEPKNYEKIAIIIAMSFIGIIATLSPIFNLNFYTEISNMFWTINVFYLLGITLASFIFIRKMMNLRGITFQKRKEMRNKSKVKKKDEIEESN